jgi:hypothetical protein
VHRQANIEHGRDEAIVYKTLHVADDGSLQSPYDGSRWEMGVPRTTEMRHTNGQKACEAGGFFALLDCREHTRYPSEAQPRTDRLVIVQCIARNIQNLGNKIRCETLCPVAYVVGLRLEYYGFFADYSAQTLVA